MGDGREGMKGKKKIKEWTNNERRKRKGRNRRKKDEN